LIKAVIPHAQNTFVTLQVDESTTVWDTIQVNTSSYVVACKLYKRWGPSLLIMYQFSSACY
jgi:hypothetical protein